MYFSFAISFKFQIKSFGSCMKTIFNYQMRNSLCDSMMAIQKNLVFEKKITKFEIIFKILDFKIKQRQQYVFLR